jgi:hypothetical protein
VLLKAERVLVKAVRVLVLILLRSCTVLSKFVHFELNLFGLNHFISSSILPGLG